MPWVSEESVSATPPPVVGRIEIRDAQALQLLRRLTNTLNLLASDERLVVFKYLNHGKRIIYSPATGAAINFSEELVGPFSMQKPKIDDKLTLLTDFGEAEAICTEVLDEPGRSDAVLLKVMARGPFEEG